MTVQTSAFRIVDVRALEADARTALLMRFDAELFRPAFPEDDIREDPRVWLDLMANDPGAPAPIVTPLIALGPKNTETDDTILGGIVIEYYRTSRSAFLTYIVVSPAAQRTGLGQALAAAAFASVTALNGGTAPVVFAEAERPEDMKTAEENLRGRARLEILSRMGAMRADLDYVQPPLAPGLHHHPLHLLAAKASLPDGAAAPSSQVLAFLDELYRALGADPATDPAFKGMAKQLSASESVRFLELSDEPPRPAQPVPAKHVASESREAAPTHVFRESPAFPGIDSFAFAYIFELQIDRPRRAGPMRAFRLDAIHRALDPDDPDARKSRSAEDQARAEAAFEDLLEPLESYHDDVTTGPPGRGGRPLVFAAQGPEETSASRAVDLIRPARWRYAAEGRRVELHAPESEAARTLALEFRDTFCAFESGRLFYMISFQPAAGTTIDEYAILQLEKLGAPSSSTEALRDRLQFRWAGERRTLMALIHARLASLGAAPKDAAPNGVRDVIAAQILERGETLAPLDWSRLRGMVVGVEDESVFEAVLNTADTSDTIAACGGEVLVCAPQSPAGQTQNSSPPPHVDPAMPEPGRRALALAGMLQGVTDFPFQDGPEIWDSTRRIHGDDETYAIFSHPSFVLEVSTDWRSMRDARSCLAHCPYLLLTWLVAAHDEIIVGEMEDALGTLLYGVDGGAHGADARRAEPLKGLARTLRTISRQIMSGPSRSLRESLALRLELFRRLTVNRSRTIFRYETEASVLAAMSEARGTGLRFDRVLDLLDRYDKLIEDIQILGQMESDRRLNIILGIVALMGTISVFADLNQSGWWPFDQGPLTPLILKTAGGAIVLAIAAMLISRLRR